MLSAPIAAGAVLTHQPVRSDRLEIKFGSNLWERKYRHAQLTRCSGSYIRIQCILGPALTRQMDMSDTIGLDGRI